MSEIELTDDEKAVAFDLVKKKATELGIAFSPNIGEDLLRERIAERQAEIETENKALEPVKTEAERLAELRSMQAYEAKQKAEKLIRVRIVCMDPSKKEYSSEYFTVGNSVIGTMTRLVPFNEPWHVPQIMLNVLKQKTFQSFYWEKTEKGRVKRSRQTKTYAIEELPALTEEELADLKERQLAQGL